VRQLEEFLKRSGFSSHSSDGDTGSECGSDVKLRSCVKRFLSLKMNQDMAKMIDIADSQKKTVSFAVNRKQRYPDDKVYKYIRNAANVRLLVRACVNRSVCKCALMLF
jgi:hypothetical protein